MMRTAHDGRVHRRRQFKPYAIEHVSDLRHQMPARRIDRPDRFVLGPRGLKEEFHHAMLQIRSHIEVRQLADTQASEETVAAIVQLDNVRDPGGNKICAYTFV
jgi:hypothetical protein